MRLLKSLRTLDALLAESSHVAPGDVAYAFSVFFSCVYRTLEDVDGAGRETLIKGMLDHFDRISRTDPPMSPTEYTLARRSIDLLRRTLGS